MLLNLSFVLLIQVVICEPENNREIVTKWWNEISDENAHLSCHHGGQNSWQIIPEIGRKFVNEKSAGKMLIKSMSCLESDSQKYWFSWSGLVKNDVIDGYGDLYIEHNPGDKTKRKSNPRTLSTSPETMNVCFQLGHSLLLQNITQVKGTFVNGVLEGNAKLVFGDKSFTVASFKNGHLHGYKRDWKFDGTLDSVSYHNFIPNSRRWQRFGAYLVYFNKNIVRDNEENHKLDLAIPLNRSMEILAGDFQQHLTMLTNIHSAKFDIVSSSKSPCLLKIKQEIGDKKSFDYSLTLNRTLEFNENLPNCKVNQTMDDANPEKQFMSWAHQIKNNGQMSMWQLKPETEPVNHEKVKQKFMTNLVHLPNETGIRFNMSIWEGPVTSWTAKALAIDDKGLFHGVCQFSADDNRTGRHDFLGWKLKMFVGKFVHGKPEGYFVLQTWKNNVITATFREGVLHGPAYALGRSSILDIEERGFIFGLGDRIHLATHFLGFFRNGQVSGTFWIGMFGGGYLHGTADSEGKATGNNIAYIYPDGETAFLGYFEDKFMRKAKAVDVVKYGCDGRGMFTVKEFTQPLSDQEFYYDPPTNMTFGGGAPLGVLDPYELKTVKLGNSSIEGSGQGVIAIRDIPIGRMVALYSLFYYRSPDEELEHLRNCAFNSNMSMDYNRECIKYALPTAIYKGRIAVPPEFDNNPLPNLGPKVNHHFRLNNTGFFEIEHPRWGQMQSVTATQNIKAGQEIFAHYGYDKNRNEPADFPHDFPWYWKAKRILELEEKLSAMESQLEKMIMQEKLLLAGKSGLLPKTEL